MIQETEVLKLRPSRFGMPRRLRRRVPDGVPAWPSALSRCRRICPAFVQNKTGWSTYGCARSLAGWGARREPVWRIW